MKRAFTIVELLVVVAIIAILAALLFPTMTAAKDQARRQTSASNLAQISKAVLLYTSDTQDQFPMAVDDERRLFHLWSPDEADRMRVGTLRMNAPVVRTLLAAYGPSAGVWRAPNDRGGKLIYGDENGSLPPKVTSNAFEAIGTSYAYANRLGFSPNSQIQLSSRTAMFAELSPNWYRSESEGDAPRMHVAYVDGHVKFVPQFSTGGFIDAWLGTTN